MNHTYFLTGYPGFLASSLIRQLIFDHKRNIQHIYVLVLPSLMNKAEQELGELIKMNDFNKDLFTIVPGDITHLDLAIDQQTNEKLKQTVTHVFHLAAIYDLAVPEGTAYKINVIGTYRVNDWVQTLTKLERYIYFSTAYVSGKRTGRIYEHELIKGQAFKNHYEKTKYEAELLVEYNKRLIPTTIIRPGVVKGDARTGETTKFDGLYFLLNVLENTRHLPFMPFFGAGKPEGNFVPADYVLKATSYLSLAPVGEGKTYHLTDPKPYKMWELQKMLTKQYTGKAPKGRVPIALIKFFLMFTPIRKWLQVEKEAMDYFKIKSSYDCSQTLTDLEGSRIICPDLKETIKPMITFYKKHKDDPNKHIKIV